MSSKVLNSTVPTALLSADSAPSPSLQPSVLLTLREKVEKLPRTVPVANKTHILAAYSQSPQKLTSDIQDDIDVWEKWDRKLNIFLQCNDDELKRLVVPVHGKFGLIRLVGFFEHLVRDRKVDEGLIEGKAKRLVDAIDAYVSFFFGPLNDILISIGTRPPHSRSAVNVETNITSSNQQIQHPNSIPPDTMINKVQAGNGGRRSWQPPPTISPK